MLIVLITSLPEVLSSRRPIKGKTRETENIPSPPINDKPNAPLSGMFSDIYANVVGQKNVIPIAKIPADKNMNIPDENESNCKPAKEKIEENNNIPQVEIFLDISPANALPMIMTPLINANTSNAFTPVSLSNDSIL